MVSTFVLGYAISESGGRFAQGHSPEQRARLEGTELPATKARYPVRSLVVMGR